MQTIEPYSIFIVWKDGVIVAAQRETKTVFRDGEGNLIAERPNPAEAIPLDLGEEVLGEINAGLLARIEADAIAHAAELAALREQLAATSQSPTAHGSTVLTELDAMFEALPEEIQTAFEVPYQTVRGLWKAGKTVRAYRFVEALTVPEGLAAAKAAILAKLGE